MGKTSGLMALLALMGLSGLPLACLAEPADNRVNDIAVDTAGNLVLNVSGEGFDPLVKLESAPNGQYRIILQSNDASLAPELTQRRQAVVQALQAKIPAIESADFSPDGGFRMVITVWQKLQPQVRGNTGSQIVIGLTGNHSLPPTVALRKQQAETAHKLAERKQQQAKAQQEAARQKAAEAAEALRQQQAKQAALRKKQQEQALALKRRQDVLLALKSAQEKEKGSLAPPQKPMVKATGEQKRPHLTALQQAQRSGKLPSIAINGENLDLSDLQQPSRNPSQIAQAFSPDSELDAINFQLTQELQRLQKQFHPGMLAQDKIPANRNQPDGIQPNPQTTTPNQAAEDEDSPDAAPSQPLKLKAAPAGFTPDEDQGNFDRPADGAPSGFQRVFSIQNTQSPYSLLNNPNANAGIQKAWQDILAGNLTGAELGLRTWLEKSPTDSIARFLLAQVLLQPTTEAVAEAQGNNSQKTTQETTARREAARQELLKIVNQSPYLPAYVALLDGYIDDENYTGAQRLWMKVSSLYPNEAAVFYEQGRLNDGLKDTATARYAYLQALTKQPGNPEFHYRLAQLELKDGHPDAAQWELSQALALAPTDSRLWKLMGFIAEKRQEPQKAARFYRQAVQADALINLARMLENQNPVSQERKEQAQSLYRAVESLAGDDLDLLYNLGMIYAGQRKADRAEAVLKHFLQLNQNPQDSRIPQAKNALKELGKKVSAGTNAQPNILPY